MCRLVPRGATEFSSKTVAERCPFVPETVNGGAMMRSLQSVLTLPAAVPDDAHKLAPVAQRSRGVFVRHPQERRSCNWCHIAARLPRYKKTGPGGTVLPTEALCGRRLRELAPVTLFYSPNSSNDGARASCSYARSRTNPVSALRFSQSSATPLIPLDHIRGDHSVQVTN